MMMLPAVLVLAYLLGSLSGSLLLGRLRGVDIRRQGSGNAGATNALRALGWRFALGVVVIDVGKGALAAWIGLHWHAADAPIAAEAQALACALAAVAGHTWPVFFGWRGGKGAGPLAGALLVLWPLVLPLLLLPWLLVIALSGYVGLATVLAAALLPLLAWLLPDATLARTLASVLAFAFIAWTHRANLARLRAGTEHRFRGLRRRRPGTPPA